MGVIPRALCVLASSVPLRQCIDVPLSPDRVNKLHRGASMPEVVVHTAGCFASAGRMYLYGDAWAPTEAGRACEALVPVI